MNPMKNNAFRLTGIVLSFFVLSSTLYGQPKDPIITGKEKITLF